MAEIPEEILRRSAEAKARATGRDVDEILAEMKGEKAPAAATAEEAPATPESVDAGAPDDSLKAKAQTPAAALPPHLLRRSAEARAKALGVPVEQVVAEMTGAASQAAGTPAPATEEPSPAAATSPPDTGSTPPVAPPANRLPEKLLIRSAEAKAKATGRPVDEIIAELRSMAPPASDPAEEAAAATEAPSPVSETAPAPAATAAKVPGKLLRRSAEAKAKATGRPVEEILAELMGDADAAAPAPAPAPAPTAAAPVAAAPDPTKAAAAAAIPEHLLRRSAEARAKATGGSAEQILAEWMGATATAPAPAPVPTADAAPAAVAPVEAPAVFTTEHVPEHLLRRSAEARAKATGRPVDEILTELKEETGAAPTPAAAPVPIADTAEAVSPPAPDDTSTLPVVETGAAIRSAGPKPMDTINVRPHLLAIEFAALLVVMALLAVFWLLRDVHLLELINLNNQPAQCKGLIIGFASITVLLGSLFLIHYTKLGRRPAFLVFGSALFGFMAIVGLMYSLHTPRGLNPESVDGLNAFELRILPGTLMLGSLILFAIFVFALSRLDSKQE